MIHSEPAAPPYSSHERSTVRAWSLSERARILLIALVALVQGTLYLFLLPPWQHYDEPTHFEYVWLFAQLGRRPEVADIDYTMRREMAATMAEHNFYWDIGVTDLLAPGRRLTVGLLELPHPPAYYALASLPLRLTGHLDLVTQLYIARGVSLLLFLLFIGVTVALMRDLTAPGHPLRWAVPLALALLPSFVNQMTAVNNDVASVLVVTLFLWGAVRTLRAGLSVPRVLWLFVVGLLAIATKTTAAPVILFIPLVLVLALWKARQWRWRWLWLGLALLVAIPLITVLSWDDAAYWYRADWDANQIAATRVSTPAAPLGDHALQLEVTPGNAGQLLLHPLSRETAQQLAGREVTFGGWIWASEQMTIPAPVLLHIAPNETRMNWDAEHIEVTTEPLFYARTLTVPENTGRVHYGLLGEYPDVTSERFRIFLDGAFLVEGALDLAQPPAFEGNTLVVQGERLDNLIRNGSAEQAGPRTSPRLAGVLNDYGRRPPDFIVMSLFDLKQSGEFLARLIVPWLVRDFFSAFAWGNVRLSPVWSTFGIGLLLASLVGATLWLFRARRLRALWPTLLILFIGLVTPWLFALLWPLSFSTTAKVVLPAGRYTYPAVVPTVLLLVGGWWALWPRRWRGWALLVLLAGLFLLNVAAILTIRAYYAAVAAM